MALLEQIMQMRSQGVSDEDIVSSLRQQGVSPKQILDALNQAQIKNAVSSGTGAPLDNSFNNGGGYQQQGMEPSIMQQEAYMPQMQGQDNSQYGYDQSQGQGQYQQQYPQYAEGQQQAYYPQDEYYQQQGMQGDYGNAGAELGGAQGYDQGQYQQDYSGAYPEGYQGNMGVSTDTIIEISEQVFSEKIKKLQKQVDELSTFKALADSKIENISQSLKRLEGLMDKLQVSILEKVGEYGQDLRTIRKEMEMVEDSFGKMLGKKVAEKSGSTSAVKKETKKSSKKK